LVRSAHSHLSFTPELTPGKFGTPAATHRAKAQAPQTQTPHRGLKKNAHRLFVTCALVNLFVSRNKLLLAA
jgi:hypothetical protein